MTPPWKKGQSGNPGGRPKQLPMLKHKCRDMTDEILEALIGIVRQSDFDSNRISAARLLLAYGYGHPTARVEVDDKSERPTEGLTRERLREIAAMELPEESEPEPDTQH